MTKKEKEQLEEKLWEEEILKEARRIIKNLLIRHGIDTSKEVTDKQKRS